MARELPRYSDEERERLRRALLEHVENKKIRYHRLAQDIADKANYGLEGDSGRRRVERFLKGTHRQNDDFIDAIARYLGSVPPPLIEESAATLADFFSRSVRQPHRVDTLIGRYRVYASTDRRAHGHEGFRETMTMNEWGEFSAPPLKPMLSRIPYAVIDMKPMQKHDALLVSETIFNFSVDPETVEFPAVPLRNNDAGVIVAFGFADREAPRYLMATRTVLEARLYRLYKVADDPLTLRGELSFNGGIQRPENMTHSDPLHPEYEVELVRIDDPTEG